MQVIGFETAGASNQLIWVKDSQKQNLIKINSFVTVCADFDKRFFVEMFQDFYRVCSCTDCAIALIAKKSVFNRP
jgi:hypothetical protein